MNIDRRTFTKSLVGAAGSLVAGSWVLGNRPVWSLYGQSRSRRRPAACHRPGSRKFACSSRRTGTATVRKRSRKATWSCSSTPKPASPASDRAGSPDTVRNVSRSVIGRNAFDTEMIWQGAFMDAHYSPGDERLHALGAIDLALWDIKGKALQVPLYQAFGGKAREHIELYATSGLPQGVVAPDEAQRMGLKERAAATMAAGWRVYRVERHPAERRWRSNRWRGGGPWSGSWRCRRSSRRPGRRAGRIPVQYACAHSTNDQSAGADPRGRWTRRRLHDRPASEVRLS